MKKALVRRVVSLFLCFCMVIGFVPIIDAQAAEIKGGTFDPHTGWLFIPLYARKHSCSVLAR